MAAMAKDGSPVAEDLHRPYVDDTVLVCPECSGDMKREPFVMDCWFDSGCASFAQWHHPFMKKENSITLPQSMHLRGC